MKKILLTKLILLWASYLTFAQCGDRYLEQLWEVRDIVVTKDIQYGSNTTYAGETMDLFLDIYEAEGDTLSNRPLIIWAFGGGFIFGSKRSPDIEAWSKDFARRGYVSASIDYRLYDGDGDPNLEAIIHAINDMRAAVRFFKKDADTDNVYRIDPEQIIVAGYSAGAITAVHTAFIRDESDIDEVFQPIIERNGGLEGDSGNEGYDSRVAGVISIAGFVYDLDLLEPNAPFLAMVHGTADETVLFEGQEGSWGSAKMQEKADDIGLPNFLYAAEGGDHYWPFLNTDDFTNDVATFMHPHLKCNFPVGLPIKEIATAVQLYPNPSTDYLNIYITDPQIIPQSVQLLTVQGQVIQSLTTNDQEIHLPLSKDLPTGTYFLKISTKKGQISKKIVVN